MTRIRLLASVLIITLAILSIGTAEAWLSDSGTLRRTISAAPGSTHQDDPKVWVCTLVGPPHDPSVKEGRNPIKVSTYSIQAEEGFSDAHPSYVVENGGAKCEVPQGEETDENSDDEPRSTDPGSTPTSPTNTTTTTTPTTTTTSPTTTTTTTPSPTTTTTTPATTTTASHENPAPSTTQPRSASDENT